MQQLESGVFSANIPSRVLALAKGSERYYLTSYDYQQVAGGLCTRR